MICDWWFKVDCNSAPEHYAESSEQLQRAQRLRQTKLRHVVRSEQGFGASGELFFRNDARPAESIQKPAVRLPQGRAFRAPNSKINKRMDNNDDDVNRSGENSNASEILYARRNNKNQNENQPQGREIQETAETSSFVKDRSTYNGYSYQAPEKSKGYEYPPPDKVGGYQYLPPKQGYSYQAPKADESLKINPKPEKLKTNANAFLSEPQPFNTRPTKKSTEMFASTIAALEVTTLKRGPVGKSLNPTTQKPQTKSTAAATTVTKRGSTTYQSSLKEAENKETIRSRIQSSNSLINGDLKTSTVSYDTTQKVNTYSTARRPNAKTKETPFYTPTIPTIRETSTAAPVTITTTIAPETTTIPTNSEIVKHALEMMESLKDLEIDSAIPTEIERYMGQRSGLEVPPSSGPNALHSLALYFANGDVNNTKRMIAQQNARLAQGINAVFVSDRTATKYEELFPHDRRSTEPSVKVADATQAPSRYNEEDDLENDLETQYSKNPVLSAAGTPQLREIAQVFTHALSAYLQDPEQFRKILSEIRPTQPPPIALNEIPRFPGENEFVRQESAYNIPRATGTTVKPEDLEIFDFSDVTTAPIREKEGETTTEFYSDEGTTTESNYITTTYYPQVTEALPPASSKLADKTPGSRLVSEKSEKSANENLSTRTGKELEESLRLPADEINGGLGSSSSTKTFFDGSKEEDETNYFPVGTNSNSNLSPYGFGVKPENSTPISDPFPTSLSDTQAIPLHWGDELTTVDPESNAFPTVYAELLPPFDINGTEVFGVPSNDLQLPNEENEESLQRAQSQSFINSRNNIYTEAKKSKTYNDYLNYNEELLLGTTNFGERITTEIPLKVTTTTIKGHFVTKAIPTTTNVPETTTAEYSTTTLFPDPVRTTLPDSGTLNTNSKTTVSYTVFLDPLTINDGLMESEESTVTPSPNTYLPRDLASHEEAEEAASIENQRRGKSQFATTPLTIRFAGDETNGNIIEPMQKRANEMFGNLNETQVNHLMNVMKKAEENKVVKRLILLLIQTCDGDDHNKTLEESRKALLNALIGMDNADGRSEIKIINTRREKSLRTTTTTTTTTTEIPITTYKSSNHEKYTSSETVSLDDAEPTIGIAEQSTNFQARFSFDNDATTQIPTTETKVTTTEVPLTTTTVTATTTTTELPVNSRTRSTDTKPKFRLKSSSVKTTGSGSVRHQKSLGTNEEFVAEASQSSSIEHKRADARALELLRSLYSLASRWGK